MSSRYFWCCILFMIFTQRISSQSNNFKSFDDVQIAYTDEGSGEVVLLLHGFINSRKSWDKTELKQDLLKAGYRVIIPDLRGNGDSQKPQHEEAYQNNAEVRDLKLLMNHLKINNYKAVGYSRGSIVLAKLLTEDNGIQKAVLGGMGIDFTNPNWEKRMMFSKAFNGDINNETQGAVDYAKSINADLRSLHLQQKFQPVATIDELSKIEIDVLVLCGDEDFENGDAQELSKVFKNGSFKMVTGNHNGTYKTKDFSLSVLQFLD